jgi:hypothetical protein
MDGQLRRGFVRGREIDRGVIQKKYKPDGAAERVFRKICEARWIYNGWLKFNVCTMCIRYVPYSHNRRNTPLNNKKSDMTQVNNYKSLNVLINYLNR